MVPTIGSAQVPRRDRSSEPMKFSPAVGATLLVEGLAGSQSLPAVLAVPMLRFHH